MKPWENIIIQENYRKKWLSLKEGQSRQYALQETILCPFEFLNELNATVCYHINCLRRTLEPTLIASTQRTPIKPQHKAFEKQLELIGNGFVCITS